MSKKPLVPVSSDAAEIPEAFINFDSYPDAAFVRIKTVMYLFACSAATVWRMVKRGALPAPRKLSERVTAWNAGELRAALAAI